MTIKVTHSTMGVSTPATVAEGAGYYRYKRDPLWTPNDGRYPREAVTGPAVCRADRAARLAEFARYLEQGLTAQQAGQLVGIAAKTARTYERELREQQRGEQP